MNTAINATIQSACLTVFKLRTNKYIIYFDAKIQIILFTLIQIYIYVHRTHYVYVCVNVYVYMYIYIYMSGSH